MKPTPIYLRTETEEEMTTFLRDNGFVFVDPETNEEEIITAGENFSLYVVGKVYRPNGQQEYDEELDDHYDVYEEAPGWHVNVLACSQDVIDKLAPLTIEAPDSPDCVWQL